MQTNRRVFTLGLGALWLSGCVSGGGGGGMASVVSRAAEPGMSPVANAGFDTWVNGFKSRAAGRGLSQSTIDTAFRGAGYLPGVIERDRNQTEFKRTLEDYLAIAASPDRIAKGRAALARHRGTLSAIESRYGVEAEVVTAVWGLESQYGERRGTVPVISALATLAYDGRRGAFFEQQLTAALRILQNGDTTPANMTGSWAGAMGHTQFIPTSYLEFAVDFTGDGRRDIWADDPTDALASAAAYLSRSGWRKGQPWGIEIRLPAGFNTGVTGRGKGRSSDAWSGLGVTTADGGRLPNHGTGSIILPQGANGPAFLIFNNFNAIARYNNAVNYVIGVGHLSDRLRGAGPIRSNFPPDATGMTMADRQDLQRRLTAAGFDTDGSDGVIGAKTRAAIAAFQRARGLPVTGEPSLSLLQTLRG
ncbi:MAG: lytic murein transglycosylase [Pseudotabrizicola sp.]|uniref:lytic murein transglycosylase n=1 Tax=Pseudotabrizicola sp. TaxID=2939647 RepID=UPI00272F2531|nr:lytic murein transglycosylase [Pseudotabrizicola sp.]MDP2080740.1 lytic murein transglycosylase [Pseudotabrizicola sp.]MDZ7574674.1 lytic murein transglycosylase [Pseudotabrizicola sp.]